MATFRDLFPAAPADDDHPPNRRQPSGETVEQAVARGVVIQRVPTSFHHIADTPMTWRKANDREAENKRRRQRAKRPVQ